ncbi:MAG TPA: ATP-binding protein [Candidatus Aquilonibacter sp.]|nr:ATP-binding protein [Candidatus Aquilonibacter sp.]
MRERSLARRAIALVLLTELVCALAFSATALWHERQSRLRAFDVMLQGRSDSLLGAVQDAEDPEDNVTIDPTELKVPAQDVWAVYKQGGRLLGSSANAPAALIARRGDGVRVESVDGRRYRVRQSEGIRIIDRLEYGADGLRRPVTILYASRTNRLWHEIAEAAGFYIAVSAGLMCATALILIVALRRLLYPLKELAVEAAGVRANSFEFDAPQSAMETKELRPLAEALSATIARLKGALDVQHRFVSDAAHELKTAVAVERSTVQLLAMRERSAEEYAEGLGRALQDNERVEQLVSRMLTLARLEERGVGSSEAIDLGGIARRTAEALRDWSKARGVSLAFELEQNVDVMLAEEPAETLVSNLVMNAVQHSSRGGVVRVAVRVVKDGERRAVLQVADQGAGIATESLPHIFERFYREDRSRSRETGGAGLGLAICKSIVESVGGTIEVESAVGRGTTVTVTFALAESTRALQVDREDQTATVSSGA